VRMVRDYGTLGEALSGEITTVLPRGILNGWQYAAALVVALFVTGNYKPGDQRRDVRRLFLACALATALPLWSTLWSRGLEAVLLQYAITTVLVWIGISVERLTIDRLVARVLPADRSS